MVFHLLQANWRYLWDAKNKIAKEHRPHLLGLLKAMVYAETEEELLERYEQEPKKDPIALGYPCCVQYLDNIYERRKAWQSVCVRICQSEEITQILL